jgi:hypothetical protein
MTLFILRGHANEQVIGYAMCSDSTRSIRKIP